MLKAGIIGLGVGEKHLEVLDKLPDIQVLAVCDFDIRKLEVARKYGYEDFFIEDAENVFELDLDLLVIASFDEFHVEHVCKAINQNMHIFVEKPLCLSFEELDKIKYAFEANPKVEMSSNFILQTEPRFIELKQKITSGCLGDIFLVQGSYDYGRLFKVTEGWRGNSKNYSVMLGGGIHMIDLICWLTNSEFNAQHNQSNNMSLPDTKFVDLQCTHGTLTNGAVCSVFANYGSRTRHHHQLKIYGTKGTYVHEFNEGTYYFGDDRKITKVNDHTKFPSSHKGWLLEKFAEYLSGNSSNLTIDKSYVIRTMEMSLNAL